jgi:hypothetical protein
MELDLVMPIKRELPGYICLFSAVLIESIGSLRALFVSTNTRILGLLCAAQLYVIEWSEDSVIVV